MDNELDIIFKQHFIKYSKSIIKEENWSENRVPNVVNMPLHEAIYLLENRGLRVKLVGQGKIVQQSLLPGERVNKGTVIKLILG